MRRGFSPSADCANRFFISDRVYFENVAAQAAVTMSDDVQQVIESAAEVADMEVSEVEERVEAKLEDLKSHQASEISETALRKHAASIVKNDLLNISSGGFGGGESTELPVLALGYQQKEGDYFVTDGDAVVALGIVNPPEDPAGLCIFLLDADHGVDVDHATSVFRPLNTVRAFVSFRQVGSRDGEPKLRKGGSPTYLANSTSSSKFEEVDPGSVSSSDPISELPDGREDKREMIHRHFITEDDAVNLQTYAEHSTATNSNGYELAFGIDIKRFRGEVVDVYSNDSGFGTMTLMDDTVFSEDDVPDELVSDQMRTPGIQVLMDPGLLQYGENSVLDVYGFVEQTDEGQYRMQGFGIVPIVEFEREFGNDSGDSGSDDAVKEDTI